MLPLANIGIPMFFPQFVLMSMAFIPIVLVEALVVRRMLGRPFGSAVGDTAIANLWTTLLGFPLAWVFMLVLDLVFTGGDGYGLATPATKLISAVLQAAWLDPYEERHLAWMIPAASITLLLPTFVLSVLIERRVLVWRWQGTERALANRTALRANLASYALLFLGGLVWLWRNLA
jgi:hypothetical protein